MRPQEVDDLLRGEAELAWRPQLTAAVMAGVRRERIRNRWFLAGAAALILLAAGIGGLALSTGLEVTGVGSEISARVPPVEVAHDAVGKGWQFLADRLDTALAPLELLPRSPGVALAIAAVVLLLIVNGATLGRPALARRRNS